MKKILVIGAMLVGIMMAVSAKYNHQPDTLPTKAKCDTTMAISEPYCYGMYDDFNPYHIQICEKILDECVKLNVLDRNGKRLYAKMKANCPKVSWYIVLIEECFQEEAFEDIQECSDLWDPYVECILIPRGLL